MALSEKSMATANSILNTMTDNFDEEVLVDGKKNLIFVYNRTY